MTLKFNWKSAEDKDLGSYKQCFLQLPEGKLIVGVRARIKTLKDVEELTKSYYPALDAFLVSQWVRVAGGFPNEPTPEDDLSDHFDVDEDPSDRENWEANLASAVRVGLRAGKRLLQSGELSFAEAENTVARFLREFTADLRDDAQSVQEAWGGDILTVTQVSELFAVPRNTVLNWINSGSLRAFRFGHKWMIRRQDLAAAMQSSAKPDPKREGEQKARSDKEGA